MTGKQFSGATATQHGRPALPGAVAAVGALKPPAYTLGAATYAEELRFGVVMYGGVGGGGGASGSPACIGSAATR